MLNLLLISVFIFCEVGNCFVIFSPNNTAVVSGERLSLECSTADNESFVREWTVKRVSDHPGSSSEPQLIFSHWKNEAVYTISPGFSNFQAQIDAFGSGVLYTNSSTIADAGLYTCIVEARQTTFRYSAQVVILQATPHCEASFKTDDFLTIGDRFWMRCIVTYRGTLAPIIQWRKHEETGDMNAAGKMVTEGIQANTVAGCNISSTITIVVTSTKDDFHFACKILFPSLDSNADSKIANNAPEFSYTWQSPVIKGDSQTTAGYSVYAVRTSVDVTNASSELANWFVMSLAFGAGMLGIVILMAMITTILCCRMKKRTMEVEKRTTIKTAAKSEDLKDVLSSKGTSVPHEPEMDDVIENDDYDKISDVIKEDDSSNMASLSNQSPANSPGYGNLLPPCQRESSVYFKIYHKDKPADYETHLTGPREVGQIESALYLTIQESDLDRLTRDSNASPYLALVRDSVDVSARDNRSSDYLKS